MENTYCGKKCAECAEREQLGCPGCRAGPGKYLAGECDCPIVKCCIRKRHLSCAACIKQEHCVTYHRGEHFSGTRLHMQQGEKREQILKAKRLIPRLGIMCVLLLLQTFLPILGADGLIVFSRAEKSFFDYLDLSVQICYGITLLSAGVGYSRFYKAGGLALGSIVLQALLSRLTTLFELIVVFIPTLIISCAAVYHEMNALAEATEFYEPRLSLRWRQLWRWCIVLVVALICLNILALSVDQNMAILVFMTILFLVFALGFHIVRLILLIRTRRCLNRIVIPPRYV